MLRRRDRDRLTSVVALVVLLGACAGNEKLPEVGPPRAIDRVLIIAPHIDDEAIGAAAYATHAARAGAQVSVMYLTAGDDNFLSAAIEDRTLWPRSRDYLREGAERIEEGRRATKLLGISTLFFLGYPDRGLEDMLNHPDKVVESRGTRLRQVPYPQALSPGADYTLANLLRDADRVAALTRPTVIITSVEFDAHPDHRAAATIGTMLAKRIRPAPVLLMYLVHKRNFPDPYRLSRAQALDPPAEFRRLNWAVHPVGPADEELKARVLASYTSQWNDPVVRLLMETFIRRNELFVRR